jgi:hypothetical protein
MTSTPDSSRTLTPEMIEEAAWRLGWLALIYAAASTFEHLVRHAFIASAIGDRGPHAAPGEASVFRPRVRVLPDLEGKSTPMLVG